MKLRDFFFPPKCVSCGELIPVFSNKLYTRGAAALCRDCRGAWEAEKLKYCKMCGFEMPDCRCMPRLLYDSGCNDLMKLVSYEGTKHGMSVSSSVIFTLKRRACGRCEHFAAEQLSSLIRTRLNLCESNLSDYVITFIPRGSAAVTEYGYDHAEILAGLVSKITGIQLKRIFCRDIKAKEQKGLDANERIKNAYETLFLCEIEKELCGKKIILLDDVVTSGSTMARGVKLSLDAGAKEAIGVCIALSNRINRKNM